MAQAPGSAATDNMPAASSEFNRTSLGVALACCVAFMFGPGPFLVASTGILLTAAAAQFEWSRSLYSTIPLCTAICSALGSTYFGNLMDRYGQRRVLLPAMACFGGAILLIALASGRGWTFFLAYLLVGIVAGSQGPVGYNKIASQWFVRKRGLVMAITAAVGSGLGYASAPMAVNAIVQRWDWSMAYAAIGGAILLVALPLCWLLLREKTATASDARQSPVELPGLTREQGLRSRSFWIVLAALSAGSFVYYGIMLHLFPMAMDRGIARNTAAALLSSVAVGGILGQLSAAFLLDRIDGPRIGLLYFLAGLAGVSLLASGTSFAQLVAGTVLMGFGQGAELSVIGYITTRLVGLRSFGALFGIIYAGAAFSGGAGPLVMGLIFDHFRSYQVGLIGGQIILAGVCALLFALPGYQFGGRK